MMASQLRDCAGEVIEAIDYVIGSRDEDFSVGLENFENALRKLRGVRYMLQDEANQLDPRPHKPRVGEGIWKPGVTQ
jgi:hypothetical protein